MSNNFVLFIALRYFWAKKNEKFVSIISIISLLGIAIGVSALIVVMSVINGFRMELINNVIGLNGDITIHPIGRVIYDHQEILAELRSEDFVNKVSPIVMGEAIASTAKGHNAVVVKGIDITDLKHKQNILNNVLSGNFSDYDGLHSIAIGSTLAENIGVMAGSKVKLISPNTISTIFGSMPRAKIFKVAAIFTSGLYDYDAVTVLMPKIAAQNFFAMGDDVNLIEVKIHDQTLTDKNAKYLQRILKYPVLVESWLDNNKHFLSALDVERVVMFLILTLIILVAAFNIISGLFMLVKDKTHDIAILKTMGASVKQIMFIFILSGFFIGFIGTFLGVFFGLLITYNIDNLRLFLEKFASLELFNPAIYFLYHLPYIINISDIIFIAIFSLVLSILVTIYPSYRAAKLNPVEAMRYE